MMKHFTKLAFLLFLLVLGSKINSVQAQCSTPSVTNKCCGIGIIQVNLYNQFSYSANYTTSKTYYNYYNSSSTCLNPDDTVYMSAISGTYPYQAGCMWLDWNQNDTFETSERLLENSSMGNGDSLYGYFVVPSNAKSGAYRMRIGGDYNYLNPGSVTYDPCNITYGDFWDFKITINSDTSYNITAVSLAGPNSLITGQDDTLSFTFSNHSKNTLDSIRVSYEFNGNTFTESLTGLNLGSCAQYTHKFSQLINVSNNGVYSAKAWVSYANGTNPDDDPKDDTATITLCTGMSGTFTVDPSSSKSYTNFHKLSEVATLLSNCYMAGPITIKVKAGTYSDSAFFNNILGISSTNTLTIDGGDANNTKMSNNKLVVLGFANANFITIKNMTIDQTYNNSTQMHYALLFDGNTNEVHIDSCIIKAPTGTAQNVLVSYGDLNKGGQNIVTNSSIKNSKLSGGYYGIFSQGDYQTQGYNFKIDRCDISNTYYYSTYFQYLDTLSITNSNYTYNTTNIYMYGPYIYQSYSSIISENTFNTYSNCLYAYYTFDLLYQNNFVFGNQYQQITLYNFGGASNIKMFHNTIRSYDVTNGNTNRTAVYVYGPTVEMRNNIIASKSSTNTCVYFNTLSNIGAMEYNNLYGESNAILMNVGGNPLSKLSDVKGYAGFNNNVFNQNPNFISTSIPNNLHLQTNVAPIQADSLAAVVYDIDGNQRCFIAPAIGADEPAYQYPDPLASFTIDDTIFVSSPFTAKNLGTKTGEYYTWLVDGSVVTGLTGKDLSYMGVSSTGSHTVTLSVQNCKGTHDTTITIVAVNPTVAPVATFYAKDSVLDEGLSTVFRNYSTMGPQSFYWEVSPGVNGTDYAYINGTDTNSFEPEIQFYTPGHYDICLTATNSAGSNQKCKTNYIIVYQNILMGSNVYTKVGEGRLFDDGGKYSNHGTNQSYDLLISPCAKDVTIEFDTTKWNLGYTAWMGIWDGMDSVSGKPLFKNYGFTNSYKPFKLTAKSGHMYIYFKSSWWTGSGFEAKWYSTPGSFPKPSAQFTAPDTAYLANTYSIKATYYDRSYTYDWDFENDGSVDANGWKNPVTFYNSGSQVCRLMVTSCGGIDTVDKTIIVMSPIQSPVADFTIDYSYVPAGCVAVQKVNPIKATYGKVMTLLDKSLYGASSWSWDITPSAFVSFENGTSSSDQNPDIAFYDTGYFTISLTVTNSYGSTTKTINNYVYVSEDYSYPYTLTPYTQAGISSFVMGDISYSSDIGSADYWDFSSLTSTCVILGGKYKFEASRIKYDSTASCRIWIDYNINGKFEGSEMAYTSNLSKNQSWNGTITIPSKSNSAVTTGFTKMRVSINRGSGVGPNGTSKTAGEYEDYGIYLVEDFEGPIIKLIGNINATVEQGKTYIDSGATATDNIDGNVAVTTIGLPLNTQTVGTYTLTYNAEDSSGNKATPANRYVTVTPDASAPYIALIGNNPDTADANITYTDPGVIAYDSVDGNVASNVVITGSVNVSVLGQYQLSYKVADTKGNTSATITRDVIVMDRIAPVITLSGSNPYMMQVGDVFSEPGYSATDNYSTNLTVTSNPSSFTATKPDTVYITYTCLDSVGNVGTTQRMLVIKDTKAPDIKLNGGDTIYHEAGVTFVDPGSVVTDDHDTGLVATVIGSINVMQLGIQTLTYVATDNSGNASSKTRYVIVQKTAKPVITLIGNANDTVNQFSTYTDPGVTITDNYYSSATLMSLLQVSGNVNTSILGDYTLTYSVTDPSNNKSADVVRNVHVRDANSITQVIESKFNVYPNPANDMINISNVKGMNLKQIVIYNQAGQLVNTVSDFSNSNLISISINEMSQGLYYVAIIDTNGQRYINKFIKN